MTERLSTKQQEVSQTPGKVDPQTGEWRPLTAAEFLKADDIPGNVEDLGIQPGERSWWVDMWDNMILGLMKRDITRERIQAQAFWGSLHTPERRARALHLPTRTPELSVLPTR